MCILFKVFDVPLLLDYFAFSNSEWLFREVLEFRDLEDFIYLFIYLF